MVVGEENAEKGRERHLSNCSPSFCRRILEHTAKAYRTRNATQVLGEREGDWLHAKHPCKGNT